jgi:hypothetical protein
MEMLTEKRNQTNQTLDEKYFYLKYSYKNLFYKRHVF